MKKIIILIAFALTLVSVSYSQTYEDRGSVYSWKWISGVLDSAESENSPSFPAYDIINLYKVVVLDTGSGANLYAEYLEKKPYAIVMVKGSGTVDSLSSLKLYGRNPDDSWTVVDTVSTAKEVSCMTTLSFNDVARFSELRFTGTVADLTVSAYNVRIYVEIVIPKTIANGGKK